MEYQREAQRRLRIGVIGVGSHSYRNILPLLTYLPVDLVAVAARNPERTERTARQYGATGYTSAEAMYATEELDAVLISVSPQMHPELTVQAFEAGMHVWLEKPAGVRAEDVQQMIAARGERVCVVGFKKAFMPATDKAMEILTAPGAGPLRTLSATYPMDIPTDGEQVLAERGTPNWLLNGCHPLSVLRRVGGPITAVAVHRSRHGGGHCVMHHDDGAVSNLVLAHGAPMFQPFERYLFTGDGSTVEIDNSRRVTYQRGIDFEYNTGTSFAPPGLDGGAIVWEAQDGLNTLENKAVFTQGLYGSLAHFCTAALAGHAPTIGTLEFALDLMRVYEAALRSDGSLIPTHAPAHEPVRPR